MLKNIALIAILTCLLSCQKSQEGNFEKSPDLSAKFIPVPTPGGDQIDTTGSSSSNYIDQAKIIKKGELRFQVNDIDSATENIEAIATRFSGYVSSSNLHSSFDQVENEMSIKIPAPNFDAAIKAIEKVSVFMDNRSIKTDDVTSEYVDVESRLKTKLEVKARYEEILHSKAKSVTDVLDAERQIGALQEEIETNEERLRYLSSQVAYSTIHLNYYQQITARQPPRAVQHSFFTEARDRFSSGFEVVKTISLTAINIWPLLIAGGIIAIFLRVRMKKKPAPAASAAKASF